jgi:hypothetical protein
VDYIVIIFSIISNNFTNYIVEIVKYFSLNTTIVNDNFYKYEKRIGNRVY